MGQYRMERLNAQLREEISKIILHGDVKDPRVSTFLSINRVEVTSDLGYAKVFVSSFLSDFSFLYSFIICPLKYNYYNFALILLY